MLPRHGRIMGLKQRSLHVHTSHRLPRHSFTLGNAVDEVADRGRRVGCTRPLRKGARQREDLLRLRPRGNSSSISSSISSSNNNNNNSNNRLSRRNITSKA
ncbi:hypothetical protein SODALDRAFT_364392 [Sodiomyces alkalinus F11]|uniref:Uncharacterized protein n=1 Tax=Sodiomyces alkalinus (strain CBS 110278 / VKM F-3762 / F11) TaxID=1314773 RepID=A0A3N2PJA1_SODAK|nr:hypothetical protein SODALDRAFT_364392 [Sodiomyces alkalinus F11]ROT34611.1 hypothetical protein SODALDRAFT_364392 [Sodiomyces alkalinus F11]